MTTADPAVHFLNVSYFFQLIYNLFFAAHAPSATGLISIASGLWLIVTIVSFFASLFLIAVIAYSTIVLHQTVDEEDKKFSTQKPQEAHEQVEKSRWSYIRQLVESTQDSDWRNAIIEADIMLGEMLTRLGFEGESIGDMLKSANPAHFATLNDAWSAHRVRNEIAHQGSQYELTDHTAYQTIGRYENVFREFHEI